MRLQKPLVIVLFCILFAMHGALYAQEPQTLVVFAASSLTDAFEEIALTFEAENPGVDVIFNFGSSSTLAAQLVEGAPADVFASANTAQMDVADEAQRVHSPQTFVHNRLVLALPADNPANVLSLNDLATAGVKLVVAAPGVPVRTYTDVVLENLAADPAYGDAYRTAVLANIVSEEDNVRQVVAKIALGEADAGFVYRSDITPDLADSVTTLPIPDDINPLATYPIATIRGAAQPELAQSFVDAVLSESGQATLARWGFTAVDDVQCAA